MLGFIECLQLGDLGLVSDSISTASTEFGLLNCSVASILRSGM